MNGQYVSGAFHGGMSRTKPAFVDIDADGDLDMFIGNQEGKITFFENTGNRLNAEWTLVTDIWLGLDIEPTYTSPEFADIDADEDFDLFLSNLVLRENTGTPQSPQFQETTDWNHPEGKPCFPYPQRFADIDADGDLDLFRGYEGGKCAGEVHFWENIGTPDSVAWGPEDTLYAGIALDGMSAPELSDIDSDGDLDLFVGDGLGNIWFYRNDGTPQEPDWVYVTDKYGDITTYGGAAPQFEDIDGDGDFDLFVGQTSWAWDHVQFYENTGTPSDAQWTHREDFMLYLDFGAQTHPELVDIDADGDVDIFAGVGGALGGGTVLMRNTGTPTHPEWTITYTDLPVNAPTFADIDNDGDYDLFKLSLMYEAVSFYENVGTPQEGDWVLKDTVLVTLPVEYSTTGETWATQKMDFADIDGDGDLDFFIGTYGPESPYGNGGKIWFSENQGTPSEAVFEAPVYYAYYGEFDLGSDSFPTLTDIDGDGDYDLIVRSFATDLFVYYFENTGTVTEARWRKITSNFLGLGDYGLIYEFGDLDGNGTNDLVIGGVTGGLRLYMNQGSLGVEGRNDFDGVLPDELQLFQNYPNPFNQGTTIGYFLARGATIEFTVHDVKGRLITSWKRVHPDGGKFFESWNGSDALGRPIPSGIYFLSLRTLTGKQSHSESVGIKAVVLR